MERIHRYKNAVVVETYDDINLKSTYKQFNDNELIIYRSWEYNQDGSNRLYNDITTGYWTKTNIKKIIKDDYEICITNIYDSDGRSKFYRDKINIKHDENNNIDIINTSKS